MFTWICPKCGREVGPSYNECPFCADAARGPSAPLPPVPVHNHPPPPQPQYIVPPPQPPVEAPPQQPHYAPPPQPQYAPQQPQYAPPPQQQYAPQPPQYAPPQYAQPHYAAPQYPPQPPQYSAPAPEPPHYAPQQPTPPPEPAPQQIYYVGADDHSKRSIPPWVAALLAFVVIAIIVSGIVWYTKRSRGATGSTDAKAAALAKANAAGNPYAKYLELTGFRIGEAAGKKLQVQFLAVNHGASDMTDIEGTITLRVKGSADAEPACTFKFRVSNVPGYAAKEVVVTEFTQKRKFFEMPDWQFLEPVLEFTSTQ